MRQNTGGFTLLEVLFALVLLGLLLTLVATSLVGGNRALERGTRYAQRLDEVRATQNFLRQSVQQILPIAFLQSARGGGELFDGQPHLMQFVAVLPGPLGGGVVLHTLELTESASSGSVLQVHFSRMGPEGLKRWGEPQVLMHDVRSLQFVYRGRDLEGHPTQWLDDWPWPRRLPQQVRITADLSGPIAWVAQVVNVQLELSGEGTSQ